MTTRDPFHIGEKEISPGTRATIELPVAHMYTHTLASMPVHVIHGKKKGACLFICAAIHGDEINGVEIIRRLLKLPILKRLHGTLIAVPIVNVFGLIQHSRYLPDRRDLNRSFPGSDKGSLAARLAHIFINEIVARSTHGIDLHTAALHRINLPQIRTNLQNSENKHLAEAFGVPVILDSNIRDGSLREATTERNIPMLVYEAGEALRFDEVAIRAGVRGIRNIMSCLDMLPERPVAKFKAEPFVARSSTWERAPIGGILRSNTLLGARIRKGDLLGVISDPFGENETELRAHTNGIVIGHTQIPLINEGEALFHIARFEDIGEVAEQVEAFHSEHSI